MSQVSHLELTSSIFTLTSFTSTGARLGQGTGFGDLEWGILCELGVVDDTTIVATTVHDVQVRLLPQYIFQTHDLPVDIICTPGQTSKLSSEDRTSSNSSPHSESPLAPVRTRLECVVARVSRVASDSRFASAPATEDALHAKQHQS